MKKPFAFKLDGRLGATQPLHRNGVGKGPGSRWKGRARVKTGLLAPTVALALGFLLIPLRGHSLTTNLAGLVEYSAFDAKLYMLQPWAGRNIAILAPTNPPLSPNVMVPILAALDAAWDYYQSATPAGRQPSALPSTTLFGRDTIAVVSSTCGAGCSYVGYTGTEILNTYFNILYNDYVTAREFDQVLFYELGRTFWLYSGQLEYHPPDIDPVVTGFAVYMRFTSMDAAGVQGGPYNGVSFLQFRTAVTNLIDAYIANPSLNWSNTLRVNRAPANSLNLGATDLIASLLMRIGRDFGTASFSQDFWKQVARRSVAFTTQEAVDNFALAACATVDQNLIGAFTNTWKFPISAAAAQEAFQRWGQPVVPHPRLSWQLIAGGQDLQLKWQTQFNTLYQLQESFDLQTWSNLGSVVVGNGGLRFLTQPVSGLTNAYFRLELR